MSVRWTLMAVSAVLAVVCVFMICDADGSDADPASGQCGNNLYWSMSGGCATFTGSGDMWDYTIDDECGWETCISVILPDGLTNIGDFAFFGCSSLASVTIPDSVTSIGNGAFEYCTSLSSVTIPDSVTSIGTDAFQGCNSLTTLYIPCNNPLGITANDSVNNGGISQNVDEDNLFPFHDYSATYTWADDGSACTVRVFCENCDYLAGIEHPAVNSVVKIPATETEMGTTEYSVSGTVEGYQYSSVKDIQDIPATGHHDDPSTHRYDRFPALALTLSVLSCLGMVGAVVLLGRRTV